MNNTIERLRMVGNIEGWSYIVLLFVAMPFKYIAGFDIAVKIAGMAHGVLFVAFVAILVEIYMRNRISHRLGLFALIASLIPFGTFFLNKKLLKLRATNQ